MSAITLGNLDISYGDTKVVHGVNLAIPEGESFALVGESGSGKSTVLRALAADYGESAHTVLRCSATESESHLPFLALADLFGLGEYLIIRNERYG